MSCYNWERGAIKLPSKIFVKFRKEYMGKYNAIQLEKLNHLRTMRDAALKQGKGKRMYSFFGCMEMMGHTCDDIDMTHKLFPNGTDDGIKPITPTKKMLAIANNKTTRFEIDGGEAGVVFDKATNSIHWYVSENNRAVESAHDTKEAKALFDMLSRVQWTRGSGGEIVGNDEYNREDDCAGGGANYVTRRYGK